MPPKKTSSRRIEVFFLLDHEGWEQWFQEIPEVVAVTESQDAFIKWVYSDGGKKFRASWSPHVIAVFVSSWSMADASSDYGDNG